MDAKGDFTPPLLAMLSEDDFDMYHILPANEDCGPLKSPFFGPMFIQNPTDVALDATATLAAKFEAAKGCRGVVFSEVMKLVRRDRSKYLAGDKKGIIVLSGWDRKESIVQVEH